jgi:hypothetical protein
MNKNSTNIDFIFLYVMIKEVNYDKYIIIIQEIGIIYIKKLLFQKMNNTNNNYYYYKKRLYIINKMIIFYSINSLEKLINIF